MKKIKSIIALISAFIIGTLSFAEESFDATSLTNSLSRSVSLSKLFSDRFNNFINNIYAYDGEDKNKTPPIVDTVFDGTWYTGFQINTDYGPEEGALAKGYADFLFGDKFGEYVFGLGIGGNSQGVFLTDIHFKTSSVAHDPVDPSVNDLIGSQMLNDIYSVLFGYGKYYWCEGYFLTESVYESQSNGVMAEKPSTSLGYCGVKTQIYDTLFTNLCIDTDFRLQAFEWTVDPLALIIKSIGADTGDQIFNSGFGIMWDNPSIFAIGSNHIEIDWNSYLLPLSFYHTVNLGTHSFTYGFGTDLAFGEIYDISGGRVSSANFGAKLGRTVLSEFDYQGEKFTYFYGYEIGVNGSYYGNVNLAKYGNDENEYAWGGDVYASLEYFGLYVKLGYRYNYFEDLKDLIECKDKNVYKVSAGLKLRF